MRVINLDLSEKVKFDIAIKEAVDCLCGGGVIIYPTDTVYGLGCDAMNVGAIDKIFRIKKRNNKKPLSVMVRNIEELKKHVFLDERAKKIIENILPGPFTVILPGVKKLPPEITGSSSNIGVRIPDHPVTRKISEDFENPIVSTSVNFADEEPMNDPFKIVDLFKEEKYQPDLILDFGKLKNAKPSTVINLIRRSPQISRSGMMSVQETKELLEKLK